MSSHFDIIVIGSGLTGLLLTHRLSKAGKKVALLEARESLGGRYHRPSKTQPYSSAGLDFFPATNEILEQLEWLKGVAPLPLQFEVREHRPQVFDEGRWRTFAGFGDVDFQSVGELSQFSQAHEVALTPGLEHLVRVLVEQLPVEAETMSEVTGFKMADGRISEVIVNGDKSWRADAVVCTPNPVLLNNWIPGEGLAAKNRTRLAKMQPWAAVYLELQHTPALVDDSSIRVFTHGAKDFEPVVGRVFGERSRWMTLVPLEQEAEHEFVGQCIRHIKRQLKRAWPLALDGKVEEKIFVQSAAFGQQSLKNKDPHRFSEIENLWVANHLLAPYSGEVAAISVAKAVESEILGGTPAITRKQETGADF